MTNVSKALERYYSRKGNRIIFRDGRSLNELALAMWTELGFQQIDASVLSRILSGKRSFTTAQLKTFCTTLQLSRHEEEHLFLCLEHDRNPELSQHIDVTRVSSSFAAEVTTEFAKDGFDMFYRAEYAAMKKRCELMQKLADMYMVSNSRKAIGEALGLNLYLEGRTIIYTSTASQAIKNVRPIFNQLLVMSEKNRSSLLRGYAHALLSDAYYSAGGRSDSPAKRKFFIMSIKLAQKAIECLPDDDREGLYAMRTMVASAHYARDEHTIHRVMKRAKIIIPMQRPENYVNVFHLSLTIDKALAAIREYDLFMTQGFTANYFQRRDLTHTGLHEISGIREEVEMLLLLKTQDKGYIENRLQLAIQLAIQYEFSRQKRHLTNILKNVRNS